MLLFLLMMSVLPQPNRRRIPLLLSISSNNCYSTNRFVSVCEIYSTDAKRLVRNTLLGRLLPYERLGVVLQEGGHLCLFCLCLQHFLFAPYVLGLMHLFTVLSHYNNL